MAKKKKPVGKQSEATDKPPDKHGQSTEAWRNNPAFMAQQWKKGQSGNINGRKPNELTLTEIHRNGLSQIVPKRVMTMLGRLLFGVSQDEQVPKEWMEQEITWGQAWALRNQFRGITPQGDRVQQMVWEMLEGKATMRVGGDGGGNPIKIQAELSSKLSYEQLKQVAQWMVEAEKKEK